MFHGELISTSLVTRSVLKFIVVEYHVTNEYTHGMDIDHIQTHTPQATMNQCYKLATFSVKRLAEEYNFYLSSQKEESATKGKLVRYRDGYLRPSKGYENGPPQLFKNFVAQL